MYKLNSTRCFRKQKINTSLKDLECYFIAFQFHKLASAESKLLGLGIMMIFYEVPSLGKTQELYLPRERINFHNYHKTPLKITDTSTLNFKHQYSHRPKISHPFTGLIIGFLPALFPSLRGNATEAKCWFILFNKELVLMTTTIGLIPILIVIILYAIILQKALKKVGELKSATSAIAVNGFETNGNHLRFFRGSAADVNRTVIERDDAIFPLKLQSNLKCFFCCSTSRSFSPENVSMTTTPRRQPSRWKAIKIVLLTTGSFLITWVCLF